MHPTDWNHDSFALSQWPRFRAFHARLCPEYLWEYTRTRIAEELAVEERSQPREGLVFNTFFSYPTDEQIRSAHKGGVFFSELREILGFRAAEALGVLAGLIRLEHDPVMHSLFTEAFERLWSSFSPYNYGHGFEASFTRSKLVLQLSGNNVFGIVSDTAWIQRVKEDLDSSRVDSWVHTPHRYLFASAVRVLRQAVGEIDAQQARVTVADLLREMNWKSLNDVYWPADDPSNPNTAEPVSPFYLIPYHLTAFTGGAPTTTGDDDSRPLRDVAFSRESTQLTMEFMEVLFNRSVVVREIGVGRPFNSADVEPLMRNPAFTGRVIGQLIKVGLADFDRSMPWHYPNQEYMLLPDAQVIG